MLAHFYFMIDVANENFQKTWSRPSYHWAIYDFLIQQASGRTKLYKRESIKKPYLEWKSNPFLTAQS